jgi:hypothetical protein
MLSYPIKNIKYIKLLLQDITSNFIYFILLIGYDSIFINDHFKNHY